MQEHYERRMGEVLRQYSIACVELTSAPMAENRPRLWWLGSRDEGFRASDWKKAVEDLHAQACGLQRQSMHPYFHASQGGRGKDVEGPPLHETEALYSKYFSEQVNKAIQANRLPKDAKAMDRRERPSARHSHLAAQNPYTQAVADCLHMALPYMYHEQDVNLDENERNCRPVVADLSQNSARARTSASGWWGTLTTSSRLYDFVSGKVLDAAQHLALLGFDISKLNLGTLTDKDSRQFSFTVMLTTRGHAKSTCEATSKVQEICDLAGNGMSLGQTTKVFIPLLKHMGYFKTAPSKSPVFNGSAGFGALSDPIRILFAVLDDKSAELFHLLLCVVTSG